MALFNWWKKVSITKKLYFVVGIMALLIAGELVTLRFAMRRLSAARAFVGAESLWSKAQKNAVFSLQRYGLTRNERDYQTYLEYLKIPEGDHKARIELFKKNGDRSIIRHGLIEGRVHPEDVDPMIELLTKFYWISYLAKAIDTWTKGDTLLFQLEDAGEQFHLAILDGDKLKAEEVLNRLKTINDELTILEEDFSLVLGIGSRWLENTVLTLLTLAVMTVESVGLSLAFFTSRAISNGLKELNLTAQSIGKGDFKRTVKVTSEDEIGQLGAAVNTMREMLQKSYSELEDRVKERTEELEKMATENARLYGEAKVAVQARDEFLSIASHELKTPITSLYLQLQRLLLLIQSKSFDLKKAEAMADASVRGGKRITVLLDELLDLTQLRVDKFELNLEERDLSLVVEEVISQLNPEATRVGSRIELHSSGSLVARFDQTRLGQVMTNLLSNAIKYGEGKPIDVFVKKEEKEALVSVRDHGPGIPIEQQGKIFERFERGRVDPHISGLGLGLYISQKIIKAHGGIISLESIPHQGSTFTVHLKS